MILNASYSVKMTKQYKKILYLYAAANETFVFLALISERRDGLVHVDKNGKVLFEHYFQIPMDTMGMLTQHEVVLLETRRNRISVLNLETHQFAYFPHQFLYEESDQSEIFTFSETKYLCIQEKGRYNENRYRLTYFQYPLTITQQKGRKITKTLAVYEAKENEWTYEHMTKKANNYSIVCWYKPRHDDSFEFKTHQIEGNKGKYRLYKFINAIAAETPTSKIETAVLSVWELFPNNFIFVCLTNKTDSRKGTVINSNFVIDLSDGKIRQTKFTFGPYQDYLIDYFNLGPNCMFRTYKYEDNKVQQTPTYYVDNASETIISEDTWQCSYLYKYEFPGYMSGAICEGIYENMDVDNFKVNLKRVVRPKEAYLHLVTNLEYQLSEQLVEDMLYVLELA